ncbi:hypothetical protein D3C87_2157820 [compost metagenome]
MGVRVGIGEAGLHAQTVERRRQVVEGLAIAQLDALDGRAFAVARHREREGDLIDLLTGGGGADEGVEVLVEGRER